MILQKPQSEDSSYIVYSDGRVWSNKTNKFLQPHQNNCGYYYYSLRIDGKQKIRLAHRLVAVSFIPNPNNLPEVNHKDENKANNDCSNLEWCSSEYNTNYGTRTRRTCKKVLCIETQTVYNSVNEATKAVGLGSPSCISECCTGKRNIAGGYHWKFVDK